MEEALEVARQVDEEYAERFGRGYGLLECYRSEDAETVLVTAGTIASTARVAIDEMRQKGKKVGLVRMRLFRPFPKVQCLDALWNAKKIAVIDRNLTPGQEGIFCEELKSTLYSGPGRIPVFGFVMGLGGTNVSPRHIREALEMAEEMDEAPMKPILDVGVVKV
jgi:pyruvate/2-oxoacid:ferredoxin oxidoreductase alpha subunit